MVEEDKKIDLNLCKLHWDGDQPILECPAAELTEATRLVQTRGILIKEIKFIEKAE